MVSITNIMDALSIDADNLSESTGIEAKRVKELYEGACLPSKLELTAILSVTEIGKDYCEGKRENPRNENERTLKAYLEKQRRLSNRQSALEVIAKGLGEAGYPISLEEVDEIYSPDDGAFNESLIRKDDPSLFVAIRKAFPDAKIKGRWWSNAVVYPRGARLKPLFDKEVIQRIAEETKNPEMVYFVGRSDLLLERFIIGQWEWDDEKVLYLINNGSFCYTHVATLDIYDGGGTFQPQKDVAKTLLIKDYCERKIAERKKP